MEKEKEKENEKEKKNEQEKENANIPIFLQIPPFWRDLVCANKCFRCVKSPRFLLLRWNVGRAR